MENLKNTLLRQNKHWQSDYKKIEYTKRDLAEKVNFSSKFIEIITGVRRSGKSTILNILIDKLIFNHKVSPKSILFINFDAPIFTPYYKNAQDLYNIIDQAEIILNKKIDYIFFDEIQNIELWEKWVKEVYDTKLFKKIIITGSNSQLLESQYISRLSGRYFSHINYPFSFKEYLHAKNIEYHQNEIDNYSIKNKLIKNFDNYLKIGGFPEVVIENNLSILENYYKTIILKDVIDNNQIKQKVTLKELAYYLITNYSSFFSYTKLGKNLNTNENTIKDYIEHLKSAYIFYDLKKFDYSIKKQNINNKKIYCIDNGLINQVAFNFSKDKGKLLENYIFLELKRRACDLFYYSNDFECDFLVKKNRKIEQAIQVCYNINKDNEKREIRGVLKVLDKYNLNKAIIITEKNDDIINIDKKKITLKPAWKWSLENY